MPTSNAAQRSRGPYAGATGRRCIRVGAVLARFVTGLMGVSASVSVRADASAVVLLTAAAAEQPQMRAEIVQGLRSASMRVVPVSALGVDPVFVACRATACARALADASGQRVALVSVAPSDAVKATLTLHLFATEGAEVELRAQITGRSLPDVVAQLVVSATQRLALGARSQLRIDSRPIGAVVWLDGTPLGVTPLERNVHPGEHVLRVALAGFTASERRLVLSAGAVASRHLQLKRELPLRQPLEAGHAASPANFVLAGVLAVGALPLLIAGGNALINDGQCLETSAGGCRERAMFGTAGAVQLTVGLVAGLTSGYFFAAQPFKLDVVRMQTRF